MNDRKEINENTRERVFQKEWIKVKAIIDKDQEFYFLHYKFIDKVDGIKIARNQQRFCLSLDYVKKYAEHFFNEYFTI